MGPERTEAGRHGEANVAGDVVGFAEDGLGNEASGLHRRVLIDAREADNAIGKPFHGSIGMNPAHHQAIMAIGEGFYGTDPIGVHGAEQSVPRQIEPHDERIIVIIEIGGVRQHTLRLAAPTGRGHRHLAPSKPAPSIVSVNCECPAPACTFGANR